MVALAALPGLLACTSPPAEPVWQGELATYLIDRHGQSEVEHRLRAADGTVRPLRFDQPPALTPGTRMLIWGEAEGEAIRVRHHQVVGAPVQAIPAALVAGMPKPTRRWVFVLVDVDGGGTMMIDKANAQTVLFGANRPDSIRSYFREVSYGVQDLDGEVIGPIPYQMGGRCDTDRLAQALTPQITGKFDQYLWFFGSTQKACDWAGVADLGRADRPTRNSWYNGFHSCTVLVQEPGHNFGMVHSSAMRCTLGGAAVPIAWPTQTGADCKHIEYGNPFDPMGGGDCGHMNGVQKAYQDWLSGCNVVKATASGTFTLYPLESACDGPQLLQIPLPQPRMFGNAGRLTSYYLELRTPVGRDQKAPLGVLVMVANDVREARYAGNNNWLLDMTPETRKLGDEALPVGKTFADALPGGPKFTVVSADAAKAVIQVELQGQAGEPGKAGKGVCGDASDFNPETPIKCIAPSTPAAPPPAKPDGGATSADAGVAADGPPATTPDAGAPGKPTSRADAAPSSSTDDPEPTSPPRPATGGCAVAPGGPGWPVVVLLLVPALVRRRRR